MTKFEKMKIMFEECILRLAVKRGLMEKDARDIVAGFIDFLSEVDRRNDPALWEYSLRLVRQVGIIDDSLFEELK